MLYLDAVGGVAGDMLLAALIDLGAPAEAIENGLDGLHLGRFNLEVTRERRHQLSGLQIHLTPPPGLPQKWRSWAEVRELLQAASLPLSAKRVALACFARLATAEARVHGVPEDKVHFHEVGAWDSLADLTGVALALDLLDLLHPHPHSICCGALPVGHGLIQAAHGKLPLPAPATLHLLQGFTVHTDGPPLERTTPSGAAILAALATPLPPTLRFKPERLGVGIGQRDPKEFPNLLRAIQAEPVSEKEATKADTKEDAKTDATPWLSETVECAEVNLDDSSPQWIGHAFARLQAAGALDTLLIPVQMKKQRPGTLLQVLYPPALREVICRVLFAETSTLGLRFYPVTRCVLPRQQYEVATPWGRVTGKLSRWEGISRFAPEYEDCRRLAVKPPHIPLRDIMQAAQDAFAADPNAARQNARQEVHLTPSPRVSNDAPAGDDSTDDDSHSSEDA